MFWGGDDGCDVIRAHIGEREEKKQTTYHHSVQLARQSWPCRPIKDKSISKTCCPKSPSLPLVTQTGPWRYWQLFVKKKRCAPYLRVPKVWKQGVSQSIRGRWRFTYVGHVDVSVCVREEEGQKSKRGEWVGWKLKERAGEHCACVWVKHPDQKHGNGMLSSYNNDLGHLIVISPWTLSP